MMGLRFLLVVAMCAAVKGGMLKIRVDDEVKIYVGGKVVYNEFTVPRWQWEELAEIPFDDNVKILAFRMYNQGPRRLGYGKGEIGGKDLFSSGIVCKDVPKKQDPDAFFPGWFEEDYDDSDWTPPKAVESHPTEGILADAQGFWGDHNSTKNVLCRLKLGGIITDTTTNAPDQLNSKGCESAEKDELAESGDKEVVYHLVKGDPESSVFCRVEVPYVEDGPEDSARDYTVIGRHLNMSEWTGLMYNVHDLDNFDFFNIYLSGGETGLEPGTVSYVIGWFGSIPNEQSGHTSLNISMTGAIVDVSVTISSTSNPQVNITYTDSQQRTRHYNIPDLPAMHYNKKVSGGIIVPNHLFNPILDAHFGRVSYEVN